MPLYQYTCESCSNDFVGKKIRKDEMFDGRVGYNKDSKEFLFIIECKMKDKPNKSICPRCNSDKNVRQSFTGYKLECWVRGDGLVKDIGGARRDMHRYKLNNEDPYGHMRATGEKDYLDDRFRLAGTDMQRMKSDSAQKSRNLSKRARSMDFNLNEDQIKIIKMIDDKEIKYEEFKNINDINKVLSSLMPDYVCKTKNGFILMALGRMLFEEFTS